ncbi:MAG: glycosyltransferase family 4 protein [Candidatus Peribacteraceae bacterium]|nr:glycosyltransferase family 4 protein [Candidatus Peribacteraceae bacterium]
MNIALVCESISGRNGWAAYTRSLARSLRLHGHVVNIVCAAGDTATAGVSILPPPLSILTNPWKNLLSALALRRYFQGHLHDIIHFTVEPYAMTVPFLPKSVREKTILTIHGSYGIRPLHLPWPWRLIAGSYYRRIARFITVSHYTMERVAGELGSWYGPAAAAAFSERTHVIENGIELTQDIHQAAQHSAQRQILLVGGIKPRKGILEALEACALYRSAPGSSPFMLSIVGEGTKEDSYVQTVRARICEHKLEDCVTLLGSVSEERLADLYRSADLYLMPSLTTIDTFEGFGLVYLEAAAHGIPSIGPNESGAEEAISEGVSGYRVDPHNAAMIAERMHWVLDEHRIDPKACRKWAEQHGAQKMTEETEKIYELIHSPQ